MHFTRCRMISTLLASVLLLSFTNAGDLTKPPLLENFKGLASGLKAHLPKVNARINKWDAAWIPADCKRITEEKNLSVAHIDTYNVHYDDCSSPWILCRHKDSPDSISHLVGKFGRIPVRSRSYVKGVISLPDNDGTHGYNSNNFIALFRRQIFDTDTTGIGILLHETGHSLDWNVLGNSDRRPLSQTKVWDMAYQSDSKVPDSYAASSFIEDVAQNVVIATYALLVPGGLQSITPKWRDIEHQVSLLKQRQKDAGNLLIPGGTCTKRLENSPPVRKTAGSAKSSGTQSGKSASNGGGLSPNVKLGDGLEIIGPTYFTTGPSRRAAMAEGRPNVDLAEGLEVIVPRAETSSEHSCGH